MDVKSALSRLSDGKNLSVAEMNSVMSEVMSGQATPAQIGALLMGLKLKGETIEEITGAAQVMRELADKVETTQTNLVDTCGTGGDGSDLFNVSTASAFVVAAVGGHVAKHGNRSVSSATGSADLLERAGVNLKASKDVIARAIDEVGVGFMFAQAHHSAMRHAIGPRKEMGLRTIFNVLGPMTNPAGVKRQVMGVYAKALCKPIAEVLKALGSEHVLVVHSDDGLDEFSVAANTHVAELKNGEVKEYSVAPSGYDHEDLSGLTVSSSQQSLDLIQGAFSGADGVQYEKARDMIALNAGAAIYVAGIASDLAEGIAMAEDALSTGLAGEKLKQLVEFTQAAS